MVDAVSGEDDDLLPVADAVAGEYADLLHVVDAVAGENADPPTCGGRCCG